LSSAILATTLTILCLLFISCVEDKKVTEPPLGRLFDFTLMDVNPNSSTYRQPVSITSLQGRPVALYAGSAG
jgi:hypothetical protein